jgi:hypothetical protein
MLYAIFGIPLTLFTVANLGSIMATAFRFIYKFVCCGLCCLCCSSGCQSYSQPTAAPSSSSSLYCKSSAGSSGARRSRRQRSAGGGFTAARGKGPSLQLHSRSDRHRDRDGSERSSAETRLMSDKEDRSDASARSTRDGRRRDKTAATAAVASDGAGGCSERLEAWRRQLTSVFTEQTNIDKVKFHSCFPLWPARTGFY